MANSSAADISSSSCSTYTAAKQMSMQKVGSSWPLLLVGARHSTQVATHEAVRLPELLLSTINHCPTSLEYRYTLEL
jgi:hypothetical protein